MFVHKFVQLILMALKISLYLRAKKTKIQISKLHDKVLLNPHISTQISKNPSSEILFFGCNFPGFFPKTTENTQ